jgi:hypothetical protein
LSRDMRRQGGKDESETKSKSKKYAQRGVLVFLELPGPRTKAGNHQKGKKKRT